MINFFSRELTNELSVVLNVIPEKNYNHIAKRFSEEGIEYNLFNGTVYIPYRNYILEPSEKDISKLTDKQRQILYCLYTRSCDGYLREKYIGKLLSLDFEEWCIPYIVKLCDEYVIEILNVIYDSLSKRNNQDIKAFCAVNKLAIQKSYFRMVSYWNEYYRKEVCDLNNYIGSKLFRECLGYGSGFSTKNTTKENKSEK